MQSIAWGAPAEFSQNPAKLTQFFRYTLGAPEAAAGPLPWSWSAARVEACTRVGVRSSG